ncbi:MAG: hypothetical protein FJY39_04525 [Betaproteobacteria bacterium]|nr:hypothetical protein [Betaproteobacteria bacterium]
METESRIARRARAGTPSSQRHALDLGGDAQPAIAVRRLAGSRRESAAPDHDRAHPAGFPVQQPLWNLDARCVDAALGGKR